MWRDVAVVAVVLDAAGDLLGKVVADFHVGREVEAELDVGAVPGALESGVDGPVPAADWSCRRWGESPSSRCRGRSARADSRPRWRG